jgi:hypothetical protein
VGTGPSHPRAQERIRQGRAQVPARSWTARVSRPPNGGPHDYDGAKKLNGRMRHLLVDTFGLICKVQVTAADVGDRDGVAQLLQGSGPAAVPPATTRLGRWLPRSLSGLGAQMPRHLLPGRCNATTAGGGGGGSPPVVHHRSCPPSPWFPAGGCWSEPCLAGSVPTAQQGLSKDYEDPTATSGQVIYWP